MRRCPIITLLIILPILASAQTSNFQTQMQQSRDINRQMTAQNQKWASERDKADRRWSMEAMRRQSMNKTATAEKKITSEEKNKQKLEEKVTKLNSDFKKQQDQLNMLEDSNSNSDDDKKNIEKTKEQIVRSEEKLNKTKSQLERSSKKLDDLKKEKEISLTKKMDLEKKDKEERERKQKQNEINKALLKNLKSN